MNPLRSLGSQLRNMFHRDRADRHLDAEMRAHLDLLEHEKRRAGLSAEQARRSARVELGGIEQVKEEVRGARAGAWFDALRRDVSFGARQLRRNPGFTAVAVLTLALGIGANTAIFSVVDATLLNVIPYPHSENILSLAENSKRTGDMGVSWPDLMDWKQQSHSFQYLGVYHFQPYALTGAGDPVQLSALQASTDFYRITEAKPEIGRLYTDAEDSPGGAPVVLLSHNLWSNRFNADPGVLGKSLALNGKPYSVIGVMPAGFWTREPADIFIPIGPIGADDEWQDRGNHPALRGIGRLKLGVTQAEALADLKIISRRIEQESPRTNSGVIPVMSLLRDDVSGDIQPTLFVLLSAVAFVLLTACANVANLLLARSSARQRELAIRAALGASRRRLFSQAIVESLLLGLLGGGLGAVLAALAIGPLLQLAPHDIRGLENVHVSLFVLGLTFGASVLSATLFGVVPAWEHSRPVVTETLKQASRALAGSRSSMRSAVLVAEVAFALVLAVGAGLMVRSLLRAQAAPLGLQPAGVLTFRVRLPESRYPNDRATVQFFEQAVERIQQVPGVESAALVRCPPMVGGCWDSVYVLGDRPIPPQAELPSLNTNVVSFGYFKTLQIPLIKGRYFTEQDVASSAPVIIINETLARRMWPNGNALGKTLKQGWPQGPAPYREIVGIVGDVKRDGPDAVQNPEAFMPLPQKPGGALAFLVRTHQDPMGAAQDVTRAIHSLDKDLPLVDLQPFSRYIGDTLARRRFSTLLLGLFGVLAVALAAIGTYGVMSYTVSLQMREMGIRVALGAQRADLLRQVVGNALLLAAIGAGVGAVGSLGLTRFMESLLFGVAATDPLTFACAALLLAGVAALSSYIPARRVMRVDPVMALRCE